LFRDRTIKVTSTIALPLTLNISGRKPFEIEAWFQRTTNRKWLMGYQMTSRDPKGVVR